MTNSELYVREVGSGPAILMLHGTPSPADMFLPLAHRVAQSYRSLIPDLPGYGRSQSIRDNSIEGVGARLVDGLAERGISRLHGIVGYSGGAYRALYGLLRHTLEAEIVVLLGGLADLDDATRAGFRELAELIDRDPTQVDTPELQNLISARNLSAAWPAAHPGDVPRLGQWLRLCSPLGLAAELRAFAAMPSLLPDLSRLRSRLYLRVGELDIACPPASSRAIAERVHGATLDVVPGCAHALLIEDAEPTELAVVNALTA